MSKLNKLRDATSLEDVAALLNFSPSGLSFILYRLPESQKYKSFEIPKRGGGARQIKAPEPRLALLQRRLATLLYDCLKELTTGSPPRRRSLSHGFEKKRSIITNASLHKRRRYVLNLDLEDFFPSINFGRVRGFFLKDRHFALKPAVATILAQICCHDNSLPQGSPCSPVVSNLVGHLLDSRLARFAKLHKCTYSRYADDITFSTSRKEFPKELALHIPESLAIWDLGAELREKIEHSGFRVNGKKTRMQLRTSRQVTTGLMVNEKVNIRAEYWRATRQMAHKLFREGRYYRLVPALPGTSAANLVRENVTSLEPLGGMLEHIFQVKTPADQRGSVNKQVYSSAACKLYSDFLFFKNFVALTRPVIVPEGPTDSIYLRSAVRSLSSLYPKLGSTGPGGFKSAVRMMNYSSTVRSLLELGCGASQLRNFIDSYKTRVSRFVHAPLEFPVIVLVDNDEGARSLFGSVKSKSNSNVDITYASSEPFYYLGLNLYVVKTPESGVAPHMSCMETFFDAKTLDTKLDGKVFDPKKEHNAPGKYGKFAFAKFVVEPNAGTIDFSGFMPLMERFVSAMKHHTAMKIGDLTSSS